MASETFPVEKSEKEWREVLSADQFRVLREHGTERAGASPLNFEKRTGVFHCAACGQPLFESTTKYESGSGWPSFWQPLPNAVATNSDTTHGMTRVEVHCKNCGGHLGHVFDDGPAPTGQRYCMNGVSLKFEPEVGGEIRLRSGYASWRSPVSRPGTSYLRRIRGRTGCLSVSDPVGTSLRAACAGLAFTSTALTSLLSRWQ